MDSLVERWKNALNSVDDKNDNHNEHKKITESEHILKKSRDEKSKASLHSQDKSKSKRLTTPSKKKASKSQKTLILEKAFEQIMQLHTFDKIFHITLKNILENIWNQAKQSINTNNGQKLQILQQQYSLQQSNITSTNSMTAKKHEKIYNQLQKKYLQSQKQKHFLKNKIDGLIHKYENIDKQLERYEKMQKLIDKCIQREDDVKNDNIRLKKLLQVSELKLVEQQRIFQQEIINIHQLMDSIKQNLQEI